MHNNYRLVAMARVVGTTMLMATAAAAQTEPAHPAPGPPSGEPKITNEAQKETPSALPDPTPPPQSTARPTPAVAPATAGTDTLAATTLEPEPELEELSDEDFAFDDELMLDDDYGLRMSGWMDVVYKDNTKDDSDPFFDVHHIYLIADAQMSDVWRAFFEMEYEHAPHLEGPKLSDDGLSVSGGKGEMKLERGYIEGTFHRAFGIRFGKFNTPIGIRSPAHWVIVTPLLAKPIHEDNKYVPGKSVGVNAFGWLPLGKQELGYSAYASNGSEVVGTNKPVDGITGFGGDLNLRLFDNLLVGASYYHQKNPGKDNRREHSALGYLELDLPKANLLVRGEGFWQERKVPNATSDRVWSTYGLAKYQMHFWEPLSLAYRYDRGLDDRRAGGQRHEIHSVNLSLQPEPYLKFSVEGNAHLFDTPDASDYEAFTFWAGVAF